MSTLELKGGLYDMISKINDQELLVQLKEIVAEVIEQNLDKTDFWDTLTSEQQTELDKALQESKKEENLVDHEVVLNKYKQWQKK
jgi:TRAP-type C4-dicarboxylate transport system substrate-binding protein